MNSGSTGCAATVLSAVYNRAMTITVITPTATQDVELPTINGDVKLFLRVKLCAYCNSPYFVTKRNQRFDGDKCKRNWFRKMRS